MWESMWMPEISIVEKMLRPLIVYLFLLVGLRLAGKRELAQLNAMDLIVLLTLSNTVQNSIIGPDNSLSGGLIGATTLLAVNYVTVRFLFGHPKIDQIVEGKPTTLLEHGTLLHDRMQKELITTSELRSMAHKQGFASLKMVDKAILEPGGFVSFVGKDPPVGEVRHSEMTARLDQISRQLEEVRTAVAGRASS